MIDMSSEDAKRPPRPAQQVGELQHTGFSIAIIMEGKSLGEVREKITKALDDAKLAYLIGETRIAR